MNTNSERENLYLSCCLTRESGLQGIMEHAFPKVRRGRLRNTWKSIWLWPCLPSRRTLRGRTRLSRCSGPLDQACLWAFVLSSQTWLPPASSCSVCPSLVTRLVPVVSPDGFLWGLFAWHTSADPTTPVQCLPYDRQHMNIHYLSEFFIRYADLSQMALTVHDKRWVCISDTNASSHVSISRDLHFLLTFIGM